jgi:class 3 adenylate cyclase
MPYFMDRHDVPDATADDVAQAHLQDLEVQRRHDVKYLTYWFDYERHSAFCLVEAPDEDRAVTVHAESHGLVPNQIMPVDRSTVEMFLGRAVDPGETGITKSAFRVIMFTDIEGSTDLTQRLGDEAAMVLLRRHDSIIRTALDAHRGSEVKHTGDGIMASFEAVTDALGCAAAIQRAIDMHNNASAEQDERFQVRIGIAAGEPVAEHGDLFGAAVQLAARLCSSASARGICVSETVRDLTIGKRFSFGPTKEVALKGFDHLVRTSDLLWTDAS